MATKPTSSSSSGGDAGADAGATSADSAAPLTPCLSSQLHAIFADDGRWRVNSTAAALHLIRRRIATLQSPPSDSGAQAAPSAAPSGGFGATAGERAFLCAQLEQVARMWAAQHSDICGWDIIDTDFDAKGSGLAEQDFREALALAGDVGTPPFVSKYFV